MNPLAKAFAIDFVRDLPPGLEPVTPALRELTRDANLTPTDVAAIAAAIAKGRAAIEDIESWFVSEFRDDVYACATEPRRLGARDTFYFEDEKRRYFILERLAAGDFAAARELAPAIIRATPGEEPTRAEVHAARQWEVIEVMLRAIAQPSDAIYSDLQKRVRALRNLPDRVGNPVRAAYKAVLVKAGLRRPRKVEPVAAAVAPTLVVRRLPPVLDVERVSLSNTGIGAITVLVQARTPGRALAWLVSPADGTRLLTVKLDPQATCELFVVVAGSAACALDAIAIAADGLQHTVPIDGAFAPATGLEALPFGLMRGFGEYGDAAPPRRTAHPASPPPPPALPPRLPPTAEQAAASIVDPVLRDAFVRLVATGSVAEAELFAVGGDGVARRFGVELARLAREFGISYSAQNQAQGRLWRWVEAGER